MITTDFLSDLKRFHLIIKKRVTSNYSGARRSIFMGRGTTVKDHRAYTPGDDIRLIDWKIYARTDDLYVKRFEEDRDMSVHIIVDSSGSMDYGSGPITKFQYASMIGVGFAYLAMRDNERFRFSTFAEELEIFESRRGMAHLASMIDHLNHVKSKGESRLVIAMEEYKKILDTKSFVILVSDFLIDIDEVKKGLFSFKNNDLKVIQVLDKAERNLDLQGDLNLRDAESKQILHTFISQKLKADYEKDLDSHVANIKKTCLGLHADFNVITTNTPIFDAFEQILKS